MNINLVLPPLRSSTGLLCLLSDSPRLSSLSEIQGLGSYKGAAHELNPMPSPEPLSRLSANLRPTSLFVGLRRSSIGLRRPSSVYFPWPLNDYCISLQGNKCRMVLHHVSYIFKLNFESEYDQYPVADPPHHRHPPSYVLDAQSDISTPFHSVETIITTLKSTTDFDSTGPPPDTPALTVASETPNSTTTATSETLDSTSSFKRAAGNDDDNESVSSDSESYFSASSSPSVVLVNLSPTTSSGVQPTINLPLAFKQSVQRAVQWRLRRYAHELDPETCREVELSISDTVDLAERILERSHKLNMLPFAGTVAGTHLPVTALAPACFHSATINSVLSCVANNVLQGSLKAIHLSGEHLLAVLTPRTVTKLTLMPRTYKMARLDISMPQTQSPLVPGEWDQDQGYN
ncbi:hypothetical protein EDD17DRAFT_1762459 [Pisolithus thermaeus]|nr:hypothetical protein EDD17DRAFT_1762459 [Pisolithus thermaeus]